jgi:hypothetical protein
MEIQILAKKKIAKLKETNYTLKIYNFSKWI